MAEMDRVVYRIEADISQLTAQLQTVQKHLAAQNQRMTDYARNIETSVGGAFLRLKGVLATVGVTLGAREIFQTADSWRLLRVQMDALTGSARVSDHYLKQLYEQSLKTGASYQQNVQTFMTFSRAAANVGITANRVMTFMSGLNTVAAATGTSAHALSIVMYQLGQSFSSGRLQGDEFRSMAENTPGLMDLFSRSALKAGQSLRAMAEAGKLTPEWMISTVEKSKVEIDKMASSAPATFSKVTGQIKAHYEELIRYLGETGGLDFYLKPLTELSNWLSSSQSKEGIRDWADTVQDAMRSISDAHPALKTLLATMGGAAAGAVVGLPALGALAAGGYMANQAGLVDAAQPALTGIAGKILDQIERIKTAIEYETGAQDLPMAAEDLRSKAEAAQREVTEILEKARAAILDLGVSVGNIPLDEVGKILLAIPANAENELAALRDEFRRRNARLSVLAVDIPKQLADYIGLSEEGRAMAPSTKLSISSGSGPGETGNAALLQKYQDAIESAYAEIQADKERFVEDVFRQYTKGSFGPISSFMTTTVDRFKSWMLSTDIVYDDPGLQSAIDAARAAVFDRAATVEASVEQMNDMYERLELLKERLAAIGQSLESGEGMPTGWQIGPFATGVRRDQETRGQAILDRILSTPSLPRSLRDNGADLMRQIRIANGKTLDELISGQPGVNKDKLKTKEELEAEERAAKAAAIKAEKVREHIKGLKEEVEYQGKVTAATKNFGVGLEQANIARKVQLELQQAGVKAGSAEAAVIEGLVKQKLEEERATELVNWRRELELEQKGKLSAIDAVGAQQGYQAEFYRLQMDYNRRKGLPEGTGVPNEWLKENDAKEMADIIAEPLKQAARVIQTSIATLVQGMLTGNFGGGGFFAQTNQFMLSAISNSVAGAVGSELTIAAGKIGENVAAWWSGKGGSTPLTTSSVGAMGAAGGYVLGSLGTAYAGMGANTGIGASLGGSLGSMAGFGLAGAMGVTGPVGAALGFGLGTLGGGLLGSFMSGSGGNNRAGSKYNLGMGLVLPGADLKSGSNQKLVNDLLTDLDNTRKFLASVGVSFSPLSMSIRAGDKSGFDLTRDGRTREFDSLSGLRKGMMQVLIESGTGFTESMTTVLEKVKDKRAEFQQDALQFAVAFDEMTAPTESLVRALTLLNAQFDQAKVKAEEYGLSVEEIETARAKAIDDLLYDSETNLRSRVESIKNVFEQLYGPLEDMIKSMDLGDMSVLSPVAQLAAAREAFRELLPSAATGDQEALQALKGAAQDYLTEAREFGASSAIYQDIYREIQQVLGNVIAQGDQRLEAIMADVPTAIRDGARDTIAELQRGFGDMIAAFNSLKSELVRRAVVA